MSEIIQHLDEKIYCECESGQEKCRTIFRERRNSNQPALGDAIIAPDVATPTWSVDGPGVVIAPRSGTYYPQDASNCDIAGRRAQREAE